MADFGLSREFSSFAHRHNQTANIGTANYKAPEAEQMQNENKDLKEPFSQDIWSLGIMCLFFIFCINPGEKYTKARTDYISNERDIDEQFLVRLDYVLPNIENA